MARLRRRRDKKICESKRKYATKDEAWAAARSLRKAKSVPARVYSCPGRYGERRHWHVTSGMRY